MKRKSILRDYAESVLLSLVIVLFIRAFIVEAVQIPSGSMENTLLPGDHLFINKFSLRASRDDEASQLLPFMDVRRKDIVVFKFLEESGEAKYYVKRVIGLAGDTVEIRSKQVLIDGEPLDEPYAVFKEPGRNDLRPRDNFGPVRVPVDEVFVLGDNRDRSFDSRFWGFLSRDRIVGKPLFIWWSFDPRDQRSAPLNLAQQAGSLLTGFFRQTRWSRMGTPVE